MALNLPGPYEIEYTLTGFINPARDHVIRGSVAALASPPAGTLPTAIDIQKMGGSTAKLNVVANQYWEFLRLIYPSSIICSGYTLWKYVTGTLAKDFVSAGAVTNPAGSGGAIVVSQQCTLTYRSANGGIMKQVFLEASLSGDARVTLVPLSSGTPVQKIAAYTMSADNVFLARDDGYPVAALRDSRGQNERIWREINR